MLYEEDRIVELLGDIASDEGLEGTTSFHLVEDRLEENREELGEIVDALSPEEIEEYNELREEVLS